MKTMTLRLLFTLAILAGLAAAPGAQTFRWEPNRSFDAGAQVDRAIEQAQRTMDRHARTMERQWEARTRAAERVAQRAELQANLHAARIERQVRAQVQRQINNEIRAYRHYAPHVSVRTSRGERYAELQTGNDADPCRNYNDRDDDYYQHCEVRDSTLPAGALNVDAGQNGGVHVEAWDRNEIRVRAIVRGSARQDARAREIANQVQVQAGGGRVSATGPDLDRREWWSVSYRINVPRKNDLDLSATNGGITIIGVTGNLRFDTTNGGVRLQDVGGRVSGDTRNGGLDVRLGGSRWDGDGLDVETSNGGVTLGSGGPPVRVRTTNGGVKINRR